MDSPFSKHHLDTSMLYLALYTLVVVIYGKAILRSRRGGLSAFPGPWISKWTGAVGQGYWTLSRRTEYVHSLHEKYGPIVRVSPEELDVSDIQAARTIHRTNKAFLKAPWYQILAPFGMQTLFNTTNVQFHREHRRLLALPMSDSYLRRMEPVIAGKVQSAMERMQEDLDKNGVVDVYKWLVAMTSDTITQLSFGCSVGLLEKGDVLLPSLQIIGAPGITEDADLGAQESQSKAQYARDLQALNDTEWWITTFPNLIGLLMYAPSTIAPSAMLASQRLVRVADECVRNYRQWLLQAADAQPTFFQAHIHSLCDEDIRHDAFTILAAGTHTTAISLTYLIWAVCKDPAIQKALVEEVSQLPESFTDDRLRELNYLNCVIDETLRLYSAAPGSLKRVVPPGGAVLGGFAVPEGTTVTTQGYTLHRNPEIFPEPERFNPSRWAEPTKAMRDSLMPFGGGTRTCIGLHLARRSLRGATTRFFRRFPNARVSAREGMSDADMEQDIHFSMSPKGRRCLIEC
ncbi:cytochrome P450 [Aspergillus ambiguus]|uniref:cytochrome P450 n=1 Tax=Aspergillus ambiguus TaxID=176160 RepID=UPI003CCD3C04